MDRGAWWATVHGTAKSQRCLGHINAMHEGERRVRYVKVRLSRILAPEKGPGEDGARLVTPVGLALPESRNGPTHSVPIRCRQHHRNPGLDFVTTCCKPPNQSTLPSAPLNRSQ